MSELTLHLLGNAHVDPVWTWDWCEGLNEGLRTCRTILDLMDEFPELTFMRGEAVIYSHIEKIDPQTFERIRAQVEAGRWDIVGGNYLQLDDNMPAIETFARHYLRGKSYFESRFGKTVRAAWAADPFGHSAGVPEVLAAAGFESFSFTRPGEAQFHLDKPAFWWEGPGGSRILCYRAFNGGYCCERDSIPGLLDFHLNQAQNGGLKNYAVFYGLGNHGGGPSRRHLEDIRAWVKAHPEVKIVHSGLHRYFEALRQEIDTESDSYLPVHRGEINFCLRGCYSSVAKFKYLYRKTEALLSRAEATDAVISAALERPSANLDEAWDGVLFNSFHDILPGTVVEQVFDDQIAWMGGVAHQAQAAEAAALNQLAMQVDTTVPPPAGDAPAMTAYLAWNPHPHEFNGHVEFENVLDFRPLWHYHKRNDEVPLLALDHKGDTLPFQVIASKHSFMPDFPFRRRVVMPAKIPAFGWTLIQFGYVEGAPLQPPQPSHPVTSTEPGVIENETYCVEAKIGAAGVKFTRNGHPVFTGDGLGTTVFHDRWGSWGAMDEQPEALSISSVLEEWTITDVATLETGPQRATLWVRFAGERSRIDLTISLYAGRDAVNVEARVLWNERSARLKLIMPGGERGQFEVPGAVVERDASYGEVPGGRWVEVQGQYTDFGFASDALYNFDFKDDVFRATVVRATSYVTDVERGPEDEPWIPAVDAGELRFRFLIAPADDRLPRLAAELHQSPTVSLVPSTKGELPREHSLAALQPASIRILALKPAADGDGFILRVQAMSSEQATAHLAWLGQQIELGEVAGGAIVSWRLRQQGHRWEPQRVLITEKQ